MTEQTSLQRSKPPFRADVVGSLLRPERVKEAREQLATHDISEQQLHEIENKEIRRLVEKQKELGFQAVTDGELRRTRWSRDFLEGLEGVESYEADSGIQFHGKKTGARSIKVTGKLGFGHHPMLEHFRFLKSIAGAHWAKMTIPSPNILRLFGNMEQSPYNDPEAFTRDLADAYRDAIRAFYDAGCRYLQFDDVSWASFCSDDQREKMKAEGTDPDEAMSLYADTVNRAVADKPDDMTITMHVCRGNFRSTWLYSGGYEPVAEILFGSVNVDGFFLEYDSDRAGDFKPLRFVNNRDLQLVLGLVTSKTSELEKAEDVKHRIEEATQYVNPDQLCLSTQCGFASTEEGNELTEDEQWAKLGHVVDIAHDVWK